MAGRRDLVLAVSRCPRADIKGTFERHVSAKWRHLNGSRAGGRWGPPGAFSVLYLGRPRTSVVVEAYRHLVDPFTDAGMTGDLVQPRRLLIVEVSVTTILDLRDSEAQARVGLSDDDLVSDIGTYDACWQVARAAHQLELHGVIAPAATALGETLALFEEHLPFEELPRLVDDGEVWDGLPADPRRLRIVPREDAG